MDSRSGNAGVWVSRIGPAASINDGKWRHRGRKQTKLEGGRQLLGASELILSNIKVHKALDEGRLIISPEPSPRFPGIDGVHCPYDTHAVDLRLGDEISVPSAGTYAYDHTQTADLTEHLSRNAVKFKISAETPFKLEHGKFALGITHEIVKLPIIETLNTCLAARIEGKSSRARTGLLIHFTAPTVHLGFAGRLVLEMINLGSCPILLTPMMYIAQLIVEEVDGIPTKNPSSFQDQMNTDGTQSRGANRGTMVDPSAG